MTGSCPGSGRGPDAAQLPARLFDHLYMDNLPDGLFIGGRYGQITPRADLFHGRAAGTGNSTGYSLLYLSVQPAMAKIQSSYRYFNP